jgi:hypothetical protein
MPLKSTEYRVVQFFGHSPKMERSLPKPLFSGIENITALCSNVLQEGRDSLLMASTCQTT